jgi:hypothetical protein
MNTRDITEFVRIEILMWERGDIRFMPTRCEHGKLISGPCKDCLQEVDLAL